VQTQRDGVVEILGVPVNQIDFAGLLSQLAQWISQEIPATGCHQVCTVNPEFIMTARHAPHFAAVLQRADLRVPDGIGVLLAARLLGVQIRERVTGSDGIFRICERAATQQWSVYFLGAAPGIAEQTSSILQQRYPGLRVAGTFAGSPAAQDWPTIRQQLATARPDILLVAYGHPRQDLWIDRHRRELPVKVALGVGGAFDFVAGVTQRAPHWMQQLGLEWLHRLVREPWRWRRMLQLPRFAGLVLWEVIQQRAKLNRNQ